MTPAREDSQYMPLQEGIFPSVPIMERGVVVRVEVTGR